MRVCGAIRHRSERTVIARLAQVAGFGFVTAGAFLIVPWLGCVVAGLSLLVVGVALEVESRKVNGAG